MHSTGKLISEPCISADFLERCCPPSNTCFQLSGNIVGCCPSGETCYDFTNGQMNYPSVTTVTVTSAPQQQTQAVSVVTTTVAPAQASMAFQTFVQSTHDPGPTTTMGGGVFLGSVTTTVKTVPTGACFTLTMDGNQVPTLIQKYCSQGVAIVSAGHERVQKMDVGVLALVLAGVWAMLVVAGL
jgi:hypothetical protein